MANLHEYLTELFVGRVSVMLWSVMVRNAARSDARYDPISPTWRGMGAQMNSRRILVGGSALEDGHRPTRRTGIVLLGGVAEIDAVGR